MQRPYREAFKACVETQRKALEVVSNSAQTLAKTETDAAQDVYAKARASFDKARADGVRQVASQPQAYVPDSRDQIIATYKETFGVLSKTGGELSSVAVNGYRDVFNKFTGKAPPKKTSASKSATTGKRGTASTTASKSTAASTSAKKTASTRKTASGSANGSAAKNTGTGDSAASTSTSGDSPS